MNSGRDVFQILQIVKGDIVTAGADAIVNTTDSSFSASGGIDRAIHKAAGKELTQTLRDGRELNEGQATLTPAFGIGNAKWIIHTVGPGWQNGFCGEEGLLADCYRASLGLALEKHCESIAFPCISIGANRFPEERAAEIAIGAVYNTLSVTENSRLFRILFVCSSDKQAEIYKKCLKRMVIDRFLDLSSPESCPSDSFETKYFSYMNLLGDLEWGTPGHYQDYADQFTKISADNVSDQYSMYDRYALGMDQWNYSACLAYIIFLQRSAYWSGGLESPHCNQCRNGTVRRVLLRMRALLN